MSEDAPRVAPHGDIITPQTAVLLAWATVGVVNALFILFAAVPPGGLGVRAAHHLYDLGHMLAAGWLSWAVVWAWGKWGPSRAVWGYLTLAAASVGVAYLVLPNDLQGFAARFGGSFAFWHNLLIVLVSTGVPFAALAGRVLRRPGWRWIAVGVSVLAAAANHLMLQRDYQGAHVYLVWAGAVTLAASALTGTRWAAKLAPILAAAQTKAGRGIRGVIAVVSLSTIVVWPSPAVLSELLGTDCAILVPLIARVRVAASRPASAGHTDLIDKDWLKDRSKIPAIPPSTPRLVPDDAIVIIITAEALRADVLSQPAYARQLPEISALARRSMHFTQARSVGSDTRNAIGSIFASKHYSVLDWKMNRQRGVILTSDPTPRLNELLHERKGMPGVNIVSYPALVNANGMLRGFQEEKLVPKSKGPNSKGQSWAMADAMTDEAIARLDKHETGPLLLFMHWMDAHDPYDAGGTEGPVYERYFREVQLYDKQIGRLWRYLEKRDLLRRTVLVFCGDHGEALGEHNIPHHGVSIYDVLLRVPLIIRVPSVPPAEIEEPVSHVDIAPTLLDLMGIDTPGNYFGQSLVPFMRGQRPKLTRPIVADQRVVRALVVGRYKIMHYRQLDAMELYDLESDPKENDNLFGKADGRGERMLEALQSFFAVHQIEDTWQFRF